MAVDLLRTEPLKHLTPGYTQLLKCVSPGYTDAAHRGPAGWDLQWLVERRAEDQWHFYQVQQQCFWSKNTFISEHQVQVISHPVLCLSQSLSVFRYHLIEEHIHLWASSPGYFPPCPLSVSVSVCFQISPDWRTHSSLSIKSRLLPTMSPVCLSLSLSVFRYQWATAVFTESGLLFLSVPIVNVCELKYWKNMFWCLSVFLFCLY